MAKKDPKERVNPLHKQDDPFSGLTPQARIYLQPILPRIIALRPGASELYEGIDEATINTTRNHLYNWMMKKGVRGQFKTHKESPTLLRIVRLKITPIKVVQEQPFTPAEVFVREKLSKCKSLKEASEIVFLANEEGKVSNSMVQDIIDLWRKGEGVNPQNESTKLVKEAIRKTEDIFGKIGRNNHQTEAKP